MKDKVIAYLQEHSEQAHRAASVARALKETNVLAVRVILEELKTNGHCVTCTVLKPGLPAEDEYRLCGGKSMSFNGQILDPNRRNLFAMTDRVARRVPTTPPKSAIEPKPVKSAQPSAPQPTLVQSTVETSMKKKARANGLGKLILEALEKSAIPLSTANLAELLDYPADAVAKSLSYMRSTQRVVSQAKDGAQPVWSLRPDKTRTVRDDKRSSPTLAPQMPALTGELDRMCRAIRTAAGGVILIEGSRVITELSANQAAAIAAA